jgi:hypothetical protein
MGALLLATTNRLRVRDQHLLPLWGGAVAVLLVATLLTFAAIWTERARSVLAKAIAAFWILSVLGWLLVPVLQRLARVDAAPAATADRVLATLHGVELLVTRNAAEGDVTVDASAVSPGEMLVLRRRAGETRDDGSRDLPEDYIP